MREIIFEVCQDKVDGGYVASAIGHGIHTQAETIEELRESIQDAVDCHFEDPEEAPKVIHIRMIDETE